MRVQTPMISWHTKGTLNEPVYCVDIHPSGRIATGGEDKVIRIWKLTTNEEKIELTCLAELERHSLQVNCVRFSPDASCLASAGGDGLIILWALAPPNEKEILEIGETEKKNLENWQAKATLSHGSDVQDICWSVDGTKLLSGSIDNKLIIWSIKRETSGSGGGSSSSSNSGSNKIFQVLHDHSHFVQGVTFDPLLTYICSQSSDRTCRVFQLNLVGKTKGTYTQKLVIRNRKRDDYNNSNSNSKENDEEKDAIEEENEEEEEERKGGGGGEVKQHAMYCDEIVLPSFVRRLCFSPDGSLLVSPSGRFREFSNGSGSDSSSSNGSSGSSNDSGSCSSGNSNSDDNLSTPTISDAYSSFSGNAKVSTTSYLFVRNQLSRPALSLPCASPSLAVRFSPVFYTLRQPKEHLGLGLSYRMIFAIATRTSVMIYDTEQIQPLAIANDIHFANINDLSWSHDGNTLVAASSDGYCTFMIFTDGELGQLLPEAEVEAIKEKMEAERVRIHTKLTTSAASAKKKRKAEAEAEENNNNNQNGEIEKKDNGMVITAKKSQNKAKKEPIKPLPSIDRWVKSQQSPFNEMKRESSSGSSSDSGSSSVALTMIEETIISSPSSPTSCTSSSSTSSMPCSPIAPPNFEESPKKLKTKEEHISPLKSPRSPLPKSQQARPLSPLPQPNNSTATTSISKKPSTKPSTPSTTTKANTPNTKGKNMKSQRIDSWAKPVVAPHVVPSTSNSSSATITTTTASVLLTTPSTTNPPIASSSSEGRYCICMQARDGTLLECSGPKETCPGKNWFHPACVGIKSEEKTQEIAEKYAQWFCGQCTIARAGVTTPSKTRSPTKSPRKRPSTDSVVTPTKPPKKQASDSLNTMSTIIETPPSQLLPTQAVPSSTSSSTSVTSSSAPVPSSASTPVSFGSAISVSFGSLDDKSASKAATPNVTRLVPRSKRAISTTAATTDTAP